MSTNTFTRLKRDYMAFKLCYFYIWMFLPLVRLHLTLQQWIELYCFRSFFLRPHKICARRNFSSIFTLVLKSTDRTEWGHTLGVVLVVTTTTKNYNFIALWRKWYGCSQIGIWSVRWSCARKSYKIGVLLESIWLRDRQWNQVNKYVCRICWWSR